jgi:flagellin
MSSSVIQTNYASLVTQNYLNRSYDALTTAVTRLSSGYRINSAKDDAAGQAIANRFMAQINGLNQAARNANDGISIAQTTESAVEETNNSVQRIRELVVQAVNGSNSQSDRQSIQDEIKQRLDEIDRVSAQTQFNGVYVLRDANTLNVQVGFNDGEQIVVNLRRLTVSSLGLQDFTIAGPQGRTAAPKAADISKTFDATTSVTVTEKTAGALAARLSVGAGSVAIAAAPVVDSATDTWFASVAITPANAAEVAALQTQGFASTAGRAKTYFIDLNTKEADTTTTRGTAAFSLDTSANALSLTGLKVHATADPLTRIDLALGTISQLRGELGATMSRFDSTINTLNNTVVNLSASLSRIQDADYATEVSNMMKAQILQQAGTSALVQANQVPQLVLALLR